MINLVYQTACEARWTGRYFRQEYYAVRVQCPHCEEQHNLYGNTEVLSSDLHGRWTYIM